MNLMENYNMCEECYSEENRITPLLNPIDCLENHTQSYIGNWHRKNVSVFLSPVMRPNKHIVFYIG